MKNNINYKIIFLKSFLFFLFFILIIQIFRLQILEYNKWQQRAEGRSLFKLTYKGVRGGIYFSDGSPMAISKLTYNLYLLPKEFNKRNISKSDFVNFTSNLINVTKDNILSKLESNNYYVLLSNRLDIDIIDKLKEKYPQELGIWNVEPQYVRVYPNGSLASKILGFTRIENDNELGQYGVEQYFDGILSPSKGYFEGTKDKDFRIILNQEFSNIMSKNGVDLTLTIDKGTQALAESYAKKYLDAYKAKESIIVVMEVNTGRLLALANYPSFDSNYYWDGEIIDCTLEYYNVLNRFCYKNNQKNDLNEEFFRSNDNYNDSNRKKNNNLKVILPDNYEEDSTKTDNSDLNEKNVSNNLTEDELNRLNKYDPLVREIFRKDKLPLNEIFRNSANSVLYEPGSVVKLLTLAIALQHNVLPKDPNYELGGHLGCEKIIDATLCTFKKTPIEKLTIEDMIATSDNIGALRIALKVPKDKYLETYYNFGLGRISGVELMDEAYFKIKDFEDWNLVDIATSSYGQGIAFTPIQLTAAWNTLASGGLYYKPTILRSINDNGNQKYFNTEPQRIVVSQDIAKFTLQIAENATSKSKRTDVINFYKKYRFAGKTGTANVINENKVGYKPNVVNTSYIGSLPADNPKVTVLVWLREPRIGENGLLPEASNTALPAWIDFVEELALLLNISSRN